MFYYFLYPLSDHSILFNVFKYITFRSVGASVTAFLFCIFMAPAVIDWLSRLCVVNSTKREHAQSIHKFYEHKGKVPTMGGVLIVGSILLSCLLWGNFGNAFFNLSLIVLILFAAVGFLDDYIKLKSKSSRGLSARVKLAGQLGAGLLLAVYLFWDPAVDTKLFIPFFKTATVMLGWLYIPFVVLVLVGTSNALNLTDGLDGLAIGCFTIAAGVFGLICYIVGRIDYATYLEVRYIAQAAELSIFCAALVGAALGFLWYNSYPASIMMGDTGSLALGGALGTIAILVKKEAILIVVGGVFVWEALSVILQVFCYKNFKKRIFLMSPFHHHLQLKGWPESKVTIRLWIVAFILALLGLSMLKLR